MDLDPAITLGRKWGTAMSPLSRLGRRLGADPRRAGGLLTVGTASFEPWHLVAHLHDAAEWTGQQSLIPQLIRHQVPADAPAHLRIGLDRLEQTSRGETVLVVAADLAGEPLLERLADTRRRGGTVLAISAAATDDDLVAIAHDSVQLTALPDLAPAMHVVPLAAAGLLPQQRRPSLLRRRR